MYSIAITPEDYANALAIGKQFRCDEADFQKAEDIVKSLLPIAYLWKDAKLANIYHTPDNLILRDSINGFIFCGCVSNGQILLPTDDIV